LELVRGYDARMREFFLGSPWPAILAWAVIYVSDYALTITCARLYRRNAASKIVFEGSFELNPIFQKDVDSLKLVSPRFLLLLLLTSTQIAISWALTVPSSPEVYAFIVGAFICMELAIHVRHISNLYMFSSRSAAEQMRGRIEYARPLILRMSAVQILSFAALFAIGFAFTGSWFWAGGVASCSSLSFKNWRQAQSAARKQAAKELASAPQAGSEPA
jgi:hypothetical protein